MYSMSMKDSYFKYPSYIQVMKMSGANLQSFKCESHKVMLNYSVVTVQIVFWGKDYLQNLWFDVPVTTHLNVTKRKSNFQSDIGDQVHTCVWKVHFTYCNAET